MSSVITYKVGELRSLIKESALQYSPVKGANVDAENKRNNDKSYKDAEKAAKDYDGGLKPEKKGELPDKMDGNRTTLDYNPRTEPDKAFKDKVDAQLKGYTSKMEEENNIEKGGAEFDNDGKLKKHFTDASEKINDVKHSLANAGIMGIKHPELNPEKKTMFENIRPKAKRLEFKHTKFLSEQQMLARIPEEYKVDGQKIYMKDCNGDEYIVEYAKSEKSNIVEERIVGHNNEKKMNEQLERINYLFGYQTETEFAAPTAEQRIEESQTFQNLMDISRNAAK